jgi:hypothetical protein
MLGSYQARVQIAALYQSLEYGKTAPSHATMENLCSKFPEYTLWLMTGKTQPPFQIDPYIKTEEKIRNNKVG